MINFMSCFTPSLTLLLTFLSSLPPPIDQPNHYRIEKFPTSLGTKRFKFGIGKGLRFEFLAELLEHYASNMDGICCTLNDNVKSMYQMEIKRSEIDMETALLGEGEFGEVRKGMWRKRSGTTVAVAVKVSLSLSTPTSGCFQF